MIFYRIAVGFIAHTLLRTPLVRRLIIYLYITDAGYIARHLRTTTSVRRFMIQS